MKPITQFILILLLTFTVVPAEPENNLANFIEKAKKNIVLIEAKE